MTEHEFPQAKPDDADDVSLALETASALWKKDSRDEALRWLRKAADAAEQAGDDARALALARAGADLRSAVQGTAVSASGVPDPVEVAGTSPSVPSPSAAQSPAVSALSDAASLRRGSLPPKPTKRVLPGLSGAAEEEPASTPRRPPPPSSMRSGQSVSGPPSSSASGAASSQSVVRHKSVSPGAPPKPRVEPVDESSGDAAASAVVTPIAAVADASLPLTRTEDTRKSVPVVESDGVGIADQAPAKPSTPAASNRPESPSLPTSSNRASSGPSKTGIPVNGAKPESAFPSGVPSRKAFASSAPSSDSSKLAAAFVSLDELPKNIEGTYQVAIKQSARDRDLFLVRPLGKGQEPPPGYRIAYVVTPGGTLD